MADVRRAGYAAEWDEVVFRSDPESREFIAFWLRDGRVLAGMKSDLLPEESRLR